MKTIQLAILAFSAGTVFGQEVKTYDFLSDEDIKYAYHFHIEEKGGKVSGDITIAELDLYDETLKQQGLEPPAPTVETFTGSLEPGLVLKIKFDRQAPYSAPAGHQQTTSWQLARHPDGMVLVVPMSIRFYPADRAPYWDDSNRTFKDKSAALAARQAIKAEREPKPEAAKPKASTSSDSAATGSSLELTYPWDVEVWVGRKYQWTPDMYEACYTTVKVEVKANSRTEAERKAMSQSYSARSRFLGATIDVEPAGTQGAPYRVTKAIATRQ